MHACIYVELGNQVQGLEDVRPALGSTHFQNSPGSYIPDLLEGNEYWGEEDGNNACGCPLVPSGSWTIAVVALGDPRVSDGK